MSSSPSLSSSPFSAAVEPSADTARAAPCDDAWLSSGPSPTLHLLGLGKVGRAFLRRLPDGVLLVGATDRSATAFDPKGLDAEALCRHKDRHRTLREFPGAQPVAPETILHLSETDIVVDCTPSGPSRERVNLRLASCSSPQQSSQCATPSPLD